MKRVLAISALIASILAGCGQATEDASTAGSAACADAFADAAAVGDMEDTVEDLDRAVRACATLDEWGAASAANPSALDGVNPFEFLGNRCDFGEGLSATDLCETLLAACTEAPYADTSYCMTR